MKLKSVSQQSFILDPDDEIKVPWSGNSRKCHVPEPLQSVELDAVKQTFLSSVIPQAMSLDPFA